ncbi:type II secretion system F family protein [Photobacterium rosenbergii]|uniref:Type II secretion system F family protein n=1 Tax=Photobacterium rosenbergii TaxID=294936 RepID=A0ABU3ZF79_9GAMM|nr:type II secretion system F family protein [Photobacterium rosenbergii]MDV5168683.1 type II secretion system F family protein [Photobacterium rosenbergii]
MKFWLLLASGLLLIGGGLLLLAARMANGESVLEKRGDSQPPTFPLAARSKGERWQELARKLGLSDEWLFWVGGLSVLGAGCAAAWYWSGWLAAGGFFVLFVLSLLVCGYIRKQAFKRRILHQLPSFIAQVNRRVKVGMSLHQAVVNSVDGSAYPLQDIVIRVGQREALGAELDAAFMREAQITGVKEFMLLGAVLKVNRQYGGSVSLSLENLIELLHQNERSQRELKSLTGENRITAWVMGLTPSVMGGYMFVDDPQGLLSMWQDPSGQHVLLIALGAQVAGALMLWRMFRSL